MVEFPLYPGHPMRDTTPNWEALAGADWDAVYVSPAGIAANAERIPVLTSSLANWDSASVLWLRPAYRLPQEQWHPVAAR